MQCHTAELLCLALCFTEKTSLMLSYWTTTFCFYHSRREEEGEKDGKYLKVARQSTGASHMSMRCSSFPDFDSRALPVDRVVIECQQQSFCLLIAHSRHLAVSYQNRILSSFTGALEMLFDIPTPQLLSLQLRCAMA